MIWMDVDAALSEVPVNIAPLTDDTDFKSTEEAVAYNAAGMDLEWHFVTTGGAYTVTAVTPTTSGTYDWAHQGNGMYSIEIPASGGASINNDTEGFGWFVGKVTGVLPFRGPTIGFRAAALNNSLIDAGTTGLLGPSTAGRTANVFPDGSVEVGTGSAKVDSANPVYATLPSTERVKLHTTQPDYAPSKAGDQMDLVNAPNATAVTAIQNGLASQASVTAVQGDVTTLLGRLTAARAGYLDNLNVGGAVASQADITAINQSASRRIILTTVGQYERPESGSTVYTIEARTFDGDGAAVNADSDPALTGTGQTTGSLAANIGVITNPATGVYRWTYTVASGATIEPARFDVSATISGSTFTLSVYTQVVDLVSATFTTSDRAAIIAIQERTDNLPSDPADQSLVETAITTAQSALAALIAALNNLSQAQAQTAAAAAIAAFAPPTRVEATADKDELLAELVKVPRSGETFRHTQVAGANVGAEVDVVISEAV